MRIAVSGTHGVGKSTLIDEFLRRHPEFVHEAEPYTVMVEDLGEDFNAEPCVEDFRRQLEFNIDRLGQHTADEKVIYERCPVDFLAYIEVLDRQSAEELVEPITEAMQHLDLVVYLPLDGSSEAEEYPKLQKAVDQKLRAIFRELANVRVFEAEGSIESRLRVLERASRA